MYNLNPMNCLKALIYIFENLFRGSVGGAGRVSKERQEYVCTVSLGCLAGQPADDKIPVHLELS